MKFVAKVVFSYIFVLGLAFTFLVPPLQKPDEHGHFKRAVYLRQGYVFLWNDGKKLPLDKQFYGLITNKHLNSIPYHPDQKFNFSLYKKPPIAPKSAFSPVYLNEKAEFMLGAFAYIPHAVGLLIARILHLNEYLSFFMGRFFMFLTSFIWMVVLYRNTKKPYNNILLFAFSLPMTIHQISAYNYDGMNYMTGFTLFSVFTRLLNSSKITTKQLLIYAITLLLFLISKVIYEPMILLTFLLPWKKIANNKKEYALKMFVLIAGVLSIYFLLKSPIYFSSLGYKGHPDGVNPVKQLLFIMENPLRYMYIFFTSAFSLLKFHIQGIIGIFGWLDYSMAPLLYFVWLGAGLIILLSSKPDVHERMSFRRVMFLYGIIFIVYAVIQTFFYLNWKTVGSPVIDGTQGRYFISLMPFFLLGGLQNKYRIKLPKINRRVFPMLFIVLVFVVLVSIVNTIQTRYF